MSDERGKYGTECEKVLHLVEAEGVLLIVINGNKGTGFSASFSNLEHMMRIPEVLRNVANDIERQTIGSAVH